MAQKHLKVALLFHVNKEVLGKVYLSDVAKQFVETKEEYLFFLTFETDCWCFLHDNELQI